MKTPISKSFLKLINRVSRSIDYRISNSRADRKLTNLDPVDQGCFKLDMAAVGGFESWFNRRAKEARLFTEAVDIAALRQIDSFPSLEKDLIRTADRILSHHFSFLGSGNFCANQNPIASETDLVPGPESYTPINWHLDPVRKLEFPKNIPYDQWDLYTMRPGNSDIKYPWELSRCNHFLPLGQAYLLTGESKYAQEIIDEILDFMSQNPVGIGINWTCTMDVALRAVSWSIGLALIKDCNKISIEDREKVYKDLYQTAQFIMSNLENNYEVTSNHYLSNIVGLQFVAAELAGLNGAAIWDEFARNALEQEISIQILDDGADFESSFHYHRLVFELFLGSWRLSQFQNRPLGELYFGRLQRALTFLGTVLDHNGELPVVGDADDGRLMIATNFGTWEPKSALFILGPAGCSLEMQFWTDLALDLAPDETEWEVMWWGLSLPVTGIMRTDSHRKTAHCFADSGNIISKDKDQGSFLVITNGRVGTNGFGNHKHNDLLSFEYHDLFQPLIIDPGSYVYTSDFHSRNLMRSTASHNTVQIDGLEQNSFNPEWIFRMFADTNPKHELWSFDGNRMSYVGSHDGFTPAAETKSMHRREFMHSQSEGIFVIQDEVCAGLGSEITWAFHFHPTVEIALASEGQCAVLNGRTAKWILNWEPRDLEFKLHQGIMSPSYGIAIESVILRLKLKATSDLSQAEFRIDRVNQNEPVNPPSKLKDQSA